MVGNRIVRSLAGVFAGAVLGVAELVFLCLAVPARLIPATRALTDRTRRRLMRLERARLARWLDHDAARAYDGYGYLVVRAPFGVLAGYLIAAGLGFGGLLLGGGITHLVTGARVPVPLNLPGVRVITDSGVLGVLLGGFFVVLFVALTPAAGSAERWIAGQFLGEDRQELMRRRIAELTSTRSGVVRVVDDERRRIERDLHDGVQQRGVALAMLLGRARHLDDPARTGELVGQAYAESRRLLDELRSVAWRIYPTALDELGLRTALHNVAERSSVPVTVRYGLAERPVSEVETALYFIAREAITNAVKHAGCDGIEVVLAEDARTVRVTVTDDGAGGADPSGSGLSGLARRILALDGELTVHSPPGGPTVIAATLPREVPCG